jgi:hypothetical protein
MSYRRSQHQVAAERTWQDFVERNARIMRTPGSRWVRPSQPLRDDDEGRRMLDAAGP